MTNSGLAPAAAFSTDNASNTQAAVLATTTGSGPGLFAMTGGSGPAVWGLTGDGGGTAGLFRVQGTSATQAALGVENSAMGSAGHFKTTKRENTNSALVVETFSDGSAGTFTTHSDSGSVNIAPTVAAENNSFGMAGQFTIQNNESTNDALRASTNGGGNAIHAFTNGSGRAGLFEVDNFGARTVPALEVVSNGRGAGAGFFRTTSVLNTSAALTAEAAGNAGAILGIAEGSGTAVLGYNAFGGSAVRGLVEGSTGTAGSFRIDNATNEGVALEVTTNGSGSAARFESTAAEGQAGEFIGNVSVAGFVEANTYKYSTPRSHVLSLAPTDFISNSAAVLVSYMGGAYVYEDRGGLSYLMASILLPHGATITGMTAHVIDESVQNVNVFLMLYTFDGSSTDVVCVVASSGSGGYQSMSSSASHVVNNEDGFYIVFADTSEAWPSSDVKIRGAVITYTTTEAD